MRNQVIGSQLQGSKSLFPNLLKFAACFQKPKYLMVILYRLTENFEEKQLVMIRILLAVAYSWPLFYILNCI